MAPRSYHVRLREAVRKYGVAKTRPQDFNKSLLMRAR